MVPKYVNSREDTTYEPCLEIGRATLLRCLDVKATQQRSPTEESGNASYASYGY